MKQILLAVNYLHKRNICHRDIKAENIRFHEDDDDLQINLIDFGLSSHFRPTGKGMTGEVGTNLYMSPEMISKSYYNTKSDMWSIGILFYIMLTGCLPFAFSGNSELREMIKSG